jgi:hypothetical protein
MNARIVAFIASRLFAVYLFVMYVLNFTLVAVGAFVAGQAYPDIQGLAYAGLSFAPIFSALIAGVLWFGAGWISSRVADSLPEGGVEELSFAQWKVIIIAAIGVLFVLKGTDLLSQTLKLFTHQVSSRENAFLPLVAGSGLVYALIGIALIVGPRAIIDSFKALQSWLTKPAFPGEDQ